MQLSLVTFSHCALDPLRLKVTKVGIHGRGAAGETQRLSDDSSCREAENQKTRTIICRARTTSTDWLAQIRHETGHRRLML